MIGEREVRGRRSEFVGDGEIFSERIEFDQERVGKGVGELGLLRKGVNMIIEELGEGKEGGNEQWQEGGIKSYVEDLNR